jgi:hypothetical protein
MEDKTHGFTSGSGGNAPMAYGATGGGGTGTVILANRDQALRDILVEEYRKWAGHTDEAFEAKIKAGTCTGWPVVALEAMRRALAVGESKEVLGRFVGEPEANASLEEGGE